MTHTIDYPGGDDEILEDKDLNQVVNEEDQQKAVNNDPGAEIPEAKKEEQDDKSEKSLRDSKPV